VGKDQQNNAVLNYSRDLLNQASGILSGNGRYERRDGTMARLINDGRIEPGVDDIGHLTIVGDFQQNASGSLRMELAARDAFDRLTITGQAGLGGSLQIFSRDGFNPVIGDRFELMAFSGLFPGESRFDRIEWLGFDPALSFDVHYLDTGLVVKVVPLPGGLALFASGSLLLAALHGRRQRVVPGG
jgi:hypothetical protein